MKTMVKCMDEEDTADDWLKKVDCITDCNTASLIQDLQRGQGRRW